MSGSDDDTGGEGLRRAVPWGRSFGEYRAMFDLDGRPFAAAGVVPRVLDAGAGPAAFVAGAHARGWQAVACDPLYTLDGPAIAARVEAARADIMAMVHAERGRFVWTGPIDSPEALERHRLAALAAFLADYDAGRAAGRPGGRYRPDALPALGFEAGAFDLALCSHLLFLYADSLDTAFHVAALRELARVAAEVRVFPLLDMAGQPSPRLEPAVAALAAEGLACEVLPVPYEFQRGGNRMLRVHAARPNK